MGASQKTSPTLLQGVFQVIRHAWWLLLAVAGLFFSASIVQSVPCWGLFLLLILVCWPIWRYRIEYLLFRRRLVLDGVMQEGSRVRGLLWKGSLTKGFQVIISVGLAWLLLVLVAPLSYLHWLALAADALFLVLIYIPVTRGFSGSINAQHVGAVVRRWPLFFINGIVLTAAFMWLDYAVVGSPDTRQMAWEALAGQTYIATSDSAGCILWGASAGAAAVVDVLAWHISQQLIPGLPDMTARVIAWGFFLLRAATLAWLFTALLLGVSVALERRAARKTGSTLSAAFMVTIILLALPFFYATVVIERYIPPVSEEAGPEPLDPCAVDMAQRSALQARLDSDIELQRQQAMQAVDEEVARELDTLFADVEQGVDHYLDWYFTVLGEYQRLAAVFTADVAQAMREQLEQHLFADSDFDAVLGRLDHNLDQLTTGMFVQLAPQLQQGLAATGCNIGPLSVLPLSELDHDALRASAAATSGVGAGLLASKALASKTTAAVVGKVAAKKSFQTGAALATKTLAKKGSSTLLSAGAATAVCAPTGPVAILCGVTAGLVTWFTVDKVLIELDEVLNREEMREDILKVLKQQQALLDEQLRQKHYARINAMAARVDAAVEKTFVPANEGLRPPGQ